MIGALEDPGIEFLEVIGFRGCSKTTWGSLILPCFLALEKTEPFIIIGADTTLQAGTNIANIKHELENNSLLKQDYGTFTGEERGRSRAGTDVRVRGGMAVAQPSVIERCPHPRPFARPEDPGPEAPAVPPARGRDRRPGVARMGAKPSQDAAEIAIDLGPRDCHPN
jgi:hypothetical protein